MPPPADALARRLERRRQRGTALAILEARQMNGENREAPGLECRYHGVDGLGLGPFDHRAVEDDGGQWLAVPECRVPYQSGADRPNDKLLLAKAAFAL